MLYLKNIALFVFMDKDKINPEHYKLDGGKQAIDLIRAQLTHNEFIGFLIGNALKYEIRAGKKPGESAETDLAKAKWYREYLEKYNEKYKRDLEDKMADIREPFY